VSDKKPEPKNETKTPTPITAGDRLTVPDGDVLVRYVKGPAEGQNHFVGLARLGRIYTVDEIAAAEACFSKSPGFELVYPDDRTRIEAAWRKAQAEKAAKVVEDAAAAIVSPPEMFAKN